MFWCHFLLNEMTLFGQNNTVSFTVQKKKKEKKRRSQNGTVLKGNVGLILPLDAQRHGKKKFVPLYLSLPFSPKNQKTNKTQTLDLQR